jgi:transposase
LLAILVYGYSTGVFSSRKLKMATYDSVAFRYIAAGSHPDRRAQQVNATGRLPTPDLNGN